VNTLDPGLMRKAAVILAREYPEVARWINEEADFREQRLMEARAFIARIKLPLVPGRMI
jgi:hypothetical protein